MQNMAQKKIEILGMHEVAAMLGWSRQHVQTYRKRGRFPEPYAEVAAGPLWLKETIAEYIAIGQKGNGSQGEVGGVRDQHPGTFFVYRSVVAWRIVCSILFPAHAGVIPGRSTRRRMQNAGNVKH
jgi:predicted DNA-binding transcriptional regulator AlpA